MATLILRDGETLELELEERGDGSVCVKIVGDTNCPYLVTFTKNGRLFRHHCVNGEKGFRLKDSGQLKLASRGGALLQPTNVR